MIEKNIQFLKKFSRMSEECVQSPKKSFVQDNKETVQDEIDIMVDAIQLGK